MFQSYFGRCWRAVQAAPLSELYKKPCDEGNGGHVKPAGGILRQVDAHPTTGGSKGEWANWAIAPKPPILPDFLKQNHDFGPPLPPPNRRSASDPAPNACTWVIFSGLGFIHSFS